MKEIEADTYEENPPLFREYMSAPPDVKPIMDNQFKNVKTHARLLSKAMWYEWRMKLLDGLKEGLLKIGEGMDEDDGLLTQQEQIIQPVLPALIEEHERLEKQVSIAQAQADELADCDQDELKEARDSLMSIERDLEAKQELVEDLQSQLREREDGLADVVERKQECVDEIKEAEKIRSDCRGWSSTEVSALHGMFPFELLLSTVQSLTIHSKCYRSRRLLWVDYCLRCRISPYHDIQARTPALLHSIFVWNKRKPYSTREIAYQPYIHRRCPRIPSAASNDREALLPPDHAGTITMLAAVSNQSQGLASVR